MINLITRYRRNKAKKFAQEVLDDISFDYLITTGKTSHIPLSAVHEAKYKVKNCFTVIERSGTLLIEGRFRVLDRQTREPITLVNDRHLNIRASKHVIIRIAYSLWLSLAEHEAAEAFYYKDTRPFDPHIEVNE